MSAFFWIRKKVHWSDCDAAGVVWFPRFFGWFEDAEEELYAALGRPRHALLTEIGFGMPRVQLETKFHSPTRAGQLVRIGLASSVENARRIRHRFEIRDDSSDTLIASGSVRVACIESGSFKPRDLPEEVVRLFDRLPPLIERQARGEVDLPWT
ncbi:MAG TPA: thioesterase family protein [Vicinamibacterales bacterium]|nr:thioesterase family protein [Vicinamibacterales bacterium]